MSLFQKLVESAMPNRVRINTVKAGGGWLDHAMRGEVSLQRPPMADVIEHRAAETEKLGPQLLWEGYSTVKGYPRSVHSATRTSNMVRTGEKMGRAFSWLASERKPSCIVEFGTAFGVSGMYWLAGLEAAGDGHLFTFEANAEWARIANENLQAISPRFTLTVGMFEEHAERVLQPSSVDLAFVDAIHTSEFVFRQYAVLRPYLRPGALVLFDDISFSEDMAEAWRTLSQHEDVVSSVDLAQHVGIIELHA